MNKEKDFPAKRRESYNEDNYSPGRCPVERFEQESLPRCRGGLMEFSDIRCPPHAW